MTSSNYKPTLAPNLAEYIRGRYILLDAFLSLLISLAISFFTVLVRTDYLVEAALRFFEPSVLILLLKAVLIFFVLRKFRMVYNNF